MIKYVSPRRNRGHAQLSNLLQYLELSAVEAKVPPSRQLHSTAQSSQLKMGLKLHFVK